MKKLMKKALLSKKNRSAKKLKRVAAENANSALQYWL